MTGTRILSAVDQALASDEGHIVHLPMGGRTPAAALIEMLQEKLEADGPPLTNVRTDVLRAAAPSRR